jgi:KaiC/GvpD/RAD55 family RecA-like ATPase
MALKLVTAPPGTGKTLLLIKMIFEYLKKVVESIQILIS